MARFKITYTGSENKEPEEIEARDFIDQGDWITFRDWNESGGLRQVLRIRAANVERIERISA